MTVKGIDISSYQNSTYDTNGIDFVIVKATEGRSYINPKQKAQAATARAAGCVVGFYHFVWPGNIAAQARYFVEKCDSKEHDILALDWENTGSGTRASCAEKDAFLREVKRLRPGHRVLLYCNRDFWLNRDTTSYAADGLWIADYVTAGQPRIKANWVFHQYRSTPVDTNVGRFANRSALRKWTGGGDGGGDTEPKPPAVDLSNLVAAARRDPGLPQGGTTHAGDVKPVEAALKSEGLLDPEYATDGSFGSTTVRAYAAWQRRCGWSGDAADGIPGRESLRRLGGRHGFTVKD